MRGDNRGWMVKCYTKAIEQYERPRKVEKDSRRCSKMTPLSLANRALARGGHVVSGDLKSLV